MSTKILLALELYLLFMNVFTFLAYGVDKFRAKAKQWRIRESTLIGLAWLGGGVGAYAGMKVFHHKTQKNQFRVSIPAAIVAWVALMVFVILKLSGTDIASLFLFTN